MNTAISTGYFTGYKTGFPYEGNSTEIPITTGMGVGIHFFRWKFCGNPIEIFRDFCGNSMGIPPEILWEWEWKSSSHGNPDTNRISSKQGRIIMRK